MTTFTGVNRHPPLFQENFNQNFTEKKYIVENVKTGGNEGVTWFGSDFTGPGNKVNDGQKFIAERLPQKALDWEALEHDIAYANATDTSLKNINTVDLKMIKNSLKTVDPWFGNVAAAVGLSTKMAAERTLEAITGTNTAVYPGTVNNCKEHIKWFDKIQRRRGELPRDAPPVDDGTYNALVGPRTVVPPSVDVYKRIAAGVLGSTTQLSSFTQIVEFSLL